jgi:hypothetical protein
MVGKKKQDKCVGGRREEKVKYIGPVSYNVHFIVVL